ncbi:hypothetical protein Lal_00017783 [Lupinus albus]|nr:hypothetical protein Lal_00017783 [Lupinus albus]
MTTPILVSTSIPCARKCSKAEMHSNDVSFLINCVPRIPVEVQEQFAKAYGRLIDLLLIPVDNVALKAMATMVQYWNTELRIFEFPNVDAAPTIEEYEVLLEIPMPDRLRVYMSTKPVEVNEDIVEKILKVRPESSHIIKQARTLGLKWTFLKKHIAKMEEQQDWEMFKPAFALAIYGMVLFPFLNDMIDQSAFDVFYKFIRFEANPTPAILAESFLSFQKCHLRGGYKIRCCVQLLYIWMMTRFKHHYYSLGTRYPIRKFKRVATKEVQLGEWVKLFEEVTPRNFGTKCCLYDRHENIMYSCGSHPYMVLMGPRGCIAYTPALVLGQLKWGMNRIRDEQLQGFFFWYKDEDIPEGAVESVRKALQKISLFGENELGERKTFYTEEYKSWRNARIGKTCVPTPTLLKDSEGPSPNEIMWRDKCKLLEARLEEARDQNERYGFTIEKLEKSNRSLQEEVASIKKDYASMCSKSDKFKLIRENNELKERLKARNRVIMSSVQERKELERTLEMTMANLEISQNETSQAVSTIKNYQTALEQSHRREDEMATTHQLEMEEAAQRESKLSTDLKGLMDAYDGLLERQRRWTANWENTLIEIERAKEQWQRRCNNMINGLGDFSDGWLELFDKTRCELEAYPDIQGRPSLEEFLLDCSKVARELKRWRKESNGEFRF